MPRSSLSEFLDAPSLPDSFQKYVHKECDETESTADLSDASFTLTNSNRRTSSGSSSSIPWYAQFEENDAFSAQENTILMNLSKQLSTLQQNDMTSTIHTLENKRRVSQSIKRLSLHASMRRNSIREELPIEEESKQETTLIVDFPGAQAAREAQAAELKAQSEKRRLCAVTRFVDNQLFFLADQFRGFSQGVDAWQASCDNWARCVGETMDALMGNHQNDDSDKESQ